GADLNVAKQRPEGWRAGKPAINGQAPNQSEARPHRRAFCVFVGTQSGLTDRCDRASRTDVTRNPPFRMVKQASYLTQALRNERFTATLIFYSAKILLFISRGAEYIPLLFMTLYLLILNIIS
ncbi:hypothetical protein, partial [Raoultella ornithinolytica]|uniref:hypothetical protein n=1 Tax=Raoultella ornithinolytica TaxID=54291 RepID=UPI0039B5ECD4